MAEKREETETNDGEMPDLEQMSEDLVPVTETRAKRFYDRLRSRIGDFVARGGKRSDLTEYLFFVPDVFILLWRLTTDRRVHGKNKVLLGTGIAYFIFPLDIVPEAIVGPIGYLDDLVLAVYILNRILVDTDEAVLHEHWSGRGNVLDMIRRVLSSADRLVTTDVVKKIKRIVR
ncbi:MAG TPA: DUF1232 domain-containing protein [Thermoanaerobaculia bacterium]|nr:DUF1232 domain-containing protein [Thermoanaerobaculia bacterium]